MEISPNGARTFTGATLSPNDYEERIRNISISPGRSKQTNDPLTAAEQFALRSELGELMRISTIERPGALYGALVLSQTFETVGESIVMPIDSEEIGDMNSERDIGAGNYSHMPGVEEFGRKFANDANRANLQKK